MSVRRQLILAEFVERLRVVSVANGFQTDAGEALYIGETPSLGPDDPAAAIAIVVGDETPSYQGMQIYLELPYEIQALARADLDQPWLTVEQVIADIKTAVELEDRTLGGLVKRQIKRGTVRTLGRDDGSTAVGAAVTYLAPFTETWGDP
jgi:hypothetical protein